MAMFAINAQGIFHVSIFSNNTDRGNVAGSGDYVVNSFLTIDAIANAGYRFVRWNDGDTNNPRSITVTKDTLFTAEFEVLVYVTLVSNNPVMGSLTGEGYYVRNGTAVIGAIPNIGYRFTEWNDGNTDNPRSITVTQDTAFMAIFDEQEIFHVLVTANNPSMGNLIGEGDYIQDSMAVVEAIPNAGYRFIHWADDNRDNPRTITVTQDTIFTAVFGIQGMFHLSVFSNNPAMGNIMGDGDYVVNSPLTIDAIANDGYRFVQWNDGNTQNPRAITLTQDTLFTAWFEAIRYHVTVLTNDVNMGIVAGNGNYVANSTTIIGAIANQDYHFIEWNDGNTDNPRTITVTQDSIFTAIFEEQQMFHVSVNPNNPSMGSIIGNGDYAKDMTVTIAAIPKTGYNFTYWNDGNTDNPRTITVTQDTIFIAGFEKGVGIADRNVSTISVYPNPATDHITIVLPENVDHAVFMLYDIQGKMLIKQEVSNQDMVLMSNFANSIYIYNVRTEKQNYQGKIVKQ
jgi:hypothetical protein